MSFKSSSGSKLNQCVLAKLDISRLEWLESQDLSRFANSVTLRVNDKLNNLIFDDDNKVYLDVSQNGKLLTGSDNPIPQETRDKMFLEKRQTEDGTWVTGDLNLLASFIGAANKTFDLRLYVKYRGEEITLDEITFKTNRVMEVIHDRTELAKLSRYPYGDFLVVDDIVLRTDESFYFSDTVPFEGNIDFQGYTLKMYKTSRGYGIYRIGGNALIENMVLDITYAAEVNKTALSECYGFGVFNSGTT